MSLGGNHIDKKKWGRDKVMLKINIKLSPFTFIHSLSKMTWYMVHLSSWGLRTCFGTNGYKLPLSWLLEPL